MANNSAIDKIGKMEFFAVLPSGFYALFCLYMALVLVNPGSESAGSLQKTMGTHLEFVTKTPVTILGIFFCSYLLGSIFRVVSVAKVESFFSSKKSQFPYKSEMTDQTKIIKDNKDISQVCSGLPELEKEIIKCNITAVPLTLF